MNEWWQIRTFLKPRIYNPASKLSLRQWENIKHDFKRKLKKDGYDDTMKAAVALVERLRNGNML